MRTLAIIGLLISLSIWGGTSVVGKLAVHHFPLFTTLFLRFSIACAILLPFFLFEQRRRPLSWSSFGHLLILGSLGTTLNIGLFFFGISRASILDTSVIIALGPLLLSAAGWLWLRERFTRLNILGLALAFIGALAALTFHAATTHHSLTGNIAIFLSGFALIAYTIVSKEAIRQYSAITITTLSFFAALVAFAPLSAWEYFSSPDRFTSLPPTLLWELLYLGVGSSVIAYGLYEWSLKYVSAGQVAALSYLQPLVSMLLAMVFLQEELTWSYIAGGALVAVGIFLALNQPHHRGKPAREVLHTRHPHHRS